MREFAEKYEQILKYLKTLSGEQEVLSAIDDISHEYLQLLIKGVHAHETKKVLEATRQMAYLKSAMERHLELKGNYERFLFLIGNIMGMYKVGEAWIQEQRNTDTIRANLTALCVDQDIYNVIKTIHMNPGIHYLDLLNSTRMERSEFDNSLQKMIETGILYQSCSLRKTHSSFELTLSAKEYMNRGLKR